MINILTQNYFIKQYENSILGWNNIFYPRVIHIMLDKITLQ